ncbi:hypothetical protein HanHA300_Chr12g0431411 [Helianthus annuus]|nr:hypothetical protein HanHA300_Chr12g0431411 [Helianthus annuus]KAJ0491749.1 hypothetical protein HanIR_Chr12g0567221 [Helianthus annuus]
MGKGDYWDKDSISSKWTDISVNHAFQIVFQRMRDNWGSDQSNADILAKALEEFNATRWVFAYMKCWELLRGSPKWSNVSTMMSSGRRKAKRSKTFYSVDPETPFSVARKIDLNNPININEDDEEVELP